MNMIKLIKKPIRKVGVKLGILKDWDAFFSTLLEPGRERPADYYDTIYESSPGYDRDYVESEYYFLWSVIFDRISMLKLPSILEVGCGPGQFAALLRDQGITNYLGFDFSPTAIQLAQKRVSEFEFQVDDALTTEIFDTYDCDVVVCTEVLEHIDEDCELVARFPKGARCLCTVPNFPFSSHVRFFNDAEEVKTRYEEFFDTMRVSTLRGIRNPDEKFFLLDGKRRTD